MVAQVIETLRKKPEGRKFDSIIEFFIDITFRLHYGPGVASAFNRNEYQESFLGGKGGRCVGWQPCHIHLLIVLLSGSLNLQETSEPVQACTGIVLPFNVAWNTVRIFWL